MDGITQPPKDYVAMYARLIRAHEAKLEASKARGSSPRTIATHERRLRRLQERYEYECQLIARDPANAHTCPICGHTC
jgi:rubrerythrin